MIDPKTRPTKRLVATLTEFVGKASGKPYLRGPAGDGHHLIAFPDEPDEAGRARWTLYLAETPRQGSMQLSSVYKGGADSLP